MQISPYAASLQTQHAQWKTGKRLLTATAATMAVVLNVNSTQPPNNKTADMFGQHAQARQTNTRRSSPQHSSNEGVVVAGLAAIAAAATRRGKRTKKTQPTS